MASFTVCKGSRIYHISLKTKIALMVGVLWHVNSDRKKYPKVYKKKTSSFPKKRISYLRIDECLTKCKPSTL